MSGGKTISTSEPRLGAIRVQQSTYGIAQPIVYGRTRISGNLIWYGDFVAIAKTETEGGKGGGGGRSSTTYTYEAAVIMALCEGPIGGVHAVWQGKKKFESTPARTETSDVQVATNTRYEEGGYVSDWATQTVTTDIPAKSALEQIGLSLSVGTPGQPVWGHLATKHAGSHQHGTAWVGNEALGYSSTAIVYGAAYALGDSADMANHAFEVVGLLPFSASIQDSEPSAIIRDLLTNPQYGAGFPVASMGSLDAYAAYCTASGLFLSPALTSQSEAREVIQTITRATNSTPVWSEGKLKIIPFADETISGNGATYTPNLVPVYDLNGDDFLVSGPDDPVKVERKTPADMFNRVQVEYLNRASAYNIEIAEAQDQAAIERSGLRSKDPVQMHAICEAHIARRAAQLVLQRALYVRNDYEFRLGWRHCLLEPMDLVTLTDAGLGLDKTPVRITQIDEDADGQLTVRAEDYPFGVASAALYPSEFGAGYAANYNAPPGSVAAPVFFEPPIAKAGETGLEVWCAVTGQAGEAGKFWGGCNVWASTDGATYKQVGSVKAGGARYGQTTSAVTSGGVGVQLTGKGGQMLSGTAQDAALLNTLCWVSGGDSGEFFAHTGAQLTATNRYTLQGLVRGAYSTPTGAKPAGQRFVRVDDAIVKSDPLPLSMIGQRLYFKFTSVNVFGAGEQSLADVPAHTHLITGGMVKLPPSDVGPVECAFEGFGIRIFWPAVPDQDVSLYELRSGASWDSGTVLAKVKGSSHFWATQLAGAKQVWVKAIDSFGNYSKNSTGKTIQVPAPSASNLTASIAGPNIVLAWQSVTGAFSLDRYEVRHGPEWANATPIAAAYTTGFSERVGYVGSRSYWVAAIDVAGNVGPAASVAVTVQAPAQVSVQSEVIDNNVLLYWTDATTALPIERYEVRRGGVYATAQAVGDNGNGRFAAIPEQVGGTLKYWVTAIDSAGNVSQPASATALVSQPPDYVLKDDFWSALDGTQSNIHSEGGKLYAPLQTQTWQQHFASRGWTSPQDQINAGYPAYFQPSADGAVYEEVIDYGAVLSSTNIAVTVSSQIVRGAVTVTPSISTKRLASDPWTDNPGQSQIVAGQFQFAKIRLDFAAAGGDDLMEVTAINVKLSTKLKNDAGSGVANASDAGGTPVLFDVAFVDVRSVMATAMGTSARHAICNFVDAPYPTGFTVFLFDTNGLRVSGPFSWAAKGS